jgi:hypothetical protein
MGANDSGGPAALQSPVFTGTRGHAVSCVTQPPGRPLPKPNYAFEKRQRELAKKRKKEEKAAARKPGVAEAPAQPPAEPLAEPVPPTP